jgi:hypothetical protein
MGGKPPPKFRSRSDQEPLAGDLIAPYAGVSLLGGGMPIVEDHDAIAKRLRELTPSTTPKAKDTALERDEV